MTFNIGRTTLAVMALALAGCPPPGNGDGGTIAPPPQAFLTISPTLIIAPGIKGTVTTNGCKSVLGVQINSTDGSFIAEVRWAGNPTAFEIDKASLNRFYAASGIALSLPLQAKVVCDDGRSNLSQSVVVTFFPVESTFSMGGTPTLPESFIAEGGLSGTATTFIGCAYLANGVNALVKVDTKGAVIAQNPTLPFPCGYDAIITERSNNGFTRWLLQPGIGAFAFDKNLNILNVAEGAYLKIGVAKDGNAILWFEDGTNTNLISRINVNQGDAGTQVAWSASFPDRMIASPVIDTTNGWVYALSWQLDMGTGVGLIVMLKYSLADGTVLNAVDSKVPYLIKQSFGIVNKPIQPVGTFNVDGTLAYVALNGFDPNGALSSVVVACGTGGGGCANTTRRWTSPAFGTQLRGLLPFSNGNFIAAVSDTEVGFLSVTDGTLQNLGQKPLRPTGSLVVTDLQPGAGADFYILASPAGGYPAEIIATDAPMNGELWRLAAGSGIKASSSMYIAVDEGGQAWLRIGPDQIKPLTLRDYRTSRGATKMP